MRTLDTVLVTVALLSVAGSALGGGFGKYMGRSRADLQECLHDARQDDFVITPHVSTVSVCFAGGFITEVNWVRSYECPEPFCALVRDELVATSQFGCDDQLLWSECYVDADLDD